MSNEQQLNAGPLNSLLNQAMIRMSDEQQLNAASVNGFQNPTIMPMNAAPLICDSHGASQWNSYGMDYPEPPLYQPASETLPNIPYPAFNHHNQYIPDNQLMGTTSPLTYHGSDVKQEPQQYPISSAEIFFSVNMHPTEIPVVYV
ncbi:hypothetical protein GWI33_011911 [Rhynchophorus ferrugineus]|uniref:Uncharacterized protein n=1 Tax=Rhynchophorus ferrugineus TaxID=354439 RepID=A0A834MLV8_RHYFE|nr:hypothetical protein GWI33_011911 [Rhynchophorus ferrugineus]